MTPEEIDKILAKAANRAASPDADRAAIERVQGEILKDLRPVRPIAPTRAFTLALVGLFAAFAVASASALGMHGIRVLSNSQRALIFTILLATAWLAASACAREMRPAAGLRLGLTALVLSVAVFPVLFSLIFQNYSADRFVSEGIPCLEAGLCVAIPTFLAIVWIFRRGFVLDWSEAGIAAGTLSGLAGLAMLELHCPNLKALHVMVWHVAVVMVSGALGFAIGRAADSFRRREAL
jgi:hypothetical protein